MVDTLGEKNFHTDYWSILGGAQLKIHLFMVAYLISYQTFWSVTLVLKLWFAFLWI